MSQPPSDRPSDTTNRVEKGFRTDGRPRRTTGWLTLPDSSRHRVAPVVAVGITILALIVSGLGTVAHGGPLPTGPAGTDTAPTPGAAQPSPGSTAVSGGHQSAAAPADGSSSTSVLSTVDLRTGAAEPGLEVYPEGLHPDAVAVDSASGDVYVANAGSGTVAVIDQATNDVVKYITVGNDPTSITLNSGTQQIITPIINKTGHFETANVTDDLLYVTNRQSNTITVINGSTNKAQSTNLSCGTGPVASSYAWGGLLVADQGSNSLAAFDTPGQSYVNGTLVFQPRVSCGFSETNVTGAGGGFHNPDAVLLHGPASGVPSPGNTPLLLVSEAGGAAVQTYCYFLAGGLVGFGFGGGVIMDNCNSFPVGTDPEGLAWDSGTGLYYVANAGSNNVTVASIGLLGADSEETKATIPVGSIPEAIAYDSANGDLYVVDNGSDNVTVISGATNHPIGSVNVGVGPDAIAYDSSNGDLYVCNWGSDNISIFNASSFLTRHSPAVGLTPVTLAWDPALASVYVGMSDSSEVSLFTPSNGSVAGAFAIEGWRNPGPNGLAFDATDGLAFAAQTSAGGVTAFNTSASPLGGNTTAFFATGAGPEAVAFDPINSQVYVANSLSDTVTQLSPDPTSVELPVGQGPDALAVDLADGTVFVANSLSDNITVLGMEPTGAPGTIASVPVGAMPDAVAYDPANGFVYVANAVSDNVSVVDTASDLVIGSVPVGAEPDAIAYDPTNGIIYVANNGSGNLTAFNASTLVNVGSVSVGPDPSAIAVNPVNGYLYVTDAGDEALSVVSPAAFAVTFTESGLPAGSTWSVTVGGVPLSSSSGSMGLSEFNGTYAFSAAPVPPVTGRGYAWEATPSTGTLSVSGGPVKVAISFARVYFEPVAFESRGLPAGATWSLTVGGTTTGNTTVSSSSPPPSTGEVTVYTPNGTLNFSITAPLGFGIADLSGKGVVNLSSGQVSGPTSWRVSFGVLTPLTFEVSPFPPFEGYTGTSWSVSLLPAVQRGGPLALSASSTGTGSMSTNASRVGFVVPAGAAYRFVITGPGPEYRLTPSHGSVHVPSAPGPLGTTVPVRFHLLTSKVALNESGAPRGADWSITITEGTSPAFHYPFSETTRAPSRLTLRLPTGTFTYTASVLNSTTPSESGYVQVVYPTAPNLTRVVFGASTSTAGCFSFTNNGTPIGSQVCNANANDIDVGFTPTPAGPCANQFTAGGANDGPSIACVAAANGLEVSWAGSASGTVIGACTWLNGTTPLGGCPIPTPVPTGFAFAGEVSYIAWTVNGLYVGVGMVAPPGANGVTFTA